MSQDTATEAKIRLLLCHNCGTIDVLPDFDGPPDYDTILQVALERHRFPNGDPHIGRLLDVPERAWETEPLRDAILEQIRQGSKGLAEADAKHYEVKDQFKEDAMSCYKAHLQPKDHCPDFNSPSKVLKPDTAADRKEAGLDPKRLPVIHLCSFCPMRTVMEAKFRKHHGQE